MNSVIIQFTYLEKGYILALLGKNGFSVSVKWLSSFPLTDNLSKISNIIDEIK